MIVVVPLGESLSPSIRFMLPVPGICICLFLRNCGSYIYICCYGCGGESKRRRSAIRVIDAPVEQHLYIQIYVKRPLYIYCAVYFVYIQRDE